MATTPRTAFVTGGSAGIGEAFAELLASKGFDLIICARREERLAAVADRIRGERGVRVELIVV